MSVASLDRPIETRHALATVALALVFWWLTFGVKLLNFWLSMGIAASTLAVLAFRFGGRAFRREELTMRAAVIGVGSAAVLYGVFWLGNFLSVRLFHFARPQVTSIYGIRGESGALVIAAVLLFITSPAEELYWRNFLQKWTMQRFGAIGGWLIGAALYGAVHVLSGNFMLTMAALIAGLFWGWIYMRERSVVPNIISHALWTVSVFLLFPIH